MATKAFVLGPGFVGREIIDRLLDEGHEVTTLVRRDSAKSEFEKAGIRAVKGDLDDRQLISKLAAESDVVFHTATADHLSSAEAILAGVKQRAADGKSTIYIHQSGASVLSDNSKGDTFNDKVYSDERPSELDALADDAPHRRIDLALLSARKELGDKAKIFIMMPPIIYGINKKYGRLSIQMPALTRFAIKNRYAGRVGKGLSAWRTIHVFDIADGYLTILHWLEQSSPQVGLEHPYFFCENGEMSWHEIAVLIGSALHRKRKIENPSPKTIPQSQYGDLFGEATPDVVGCNCRHSADRLRKLGWKPKQPGLREAYEVEDLPLLLEEKGFKKSDLTLS